MFGWQGNRRYANVTRDEEIVLRQHEINQLQLRVDAAQRDLAEAERQLDAMSPRSALDAIYGQQKELRR